MGFLSLDAGACPYLTIRYDELVVRRNTTEGYVVRWMSPGGGHQGWRVDAHSREVGVHLLRGLWT